MNEILQVQIQQQVYQTSRTYWKVLKNRLRKEGSESFAKCNRLQNETHVFLSGDINYVISQLVGLIGAKVRVTLEVEAEISTGALDHVVRTVTESSQTLKRDSHGFEKE